MALINLMSGALGFKDLSNLILDFALFWERNFMLDKETKDKIIKKFKTHEQDTGSAEVQIAILTEEIKRLTEHLKGHKKDFSSRRGLIKKVSQRRKLLKFLQRDNATSFNQLVKKLKIKIKISAVAEPLDEVVEEEVSPDEAV